LGFALAWDGVEIVGLDIDRYAVDTYNFNLNKYGAHAEVKDVLKWEPNDEWDVVMGGSPCQPFSIANTRKRGREHPLYPTFERFFDIILELKPRAFLFENVKGLVTKRYRNFLAEQLRKVRRHYRTVHRVLNVAYYGVPQRRERLFLIGIHKDVGVRPSFPEPTHSERAYVTINGQKVHKWVTVREAIGDLLAIPPSNPIKLVYDAKQIKRVLRFRRGRLDNLDEPSRTIKVDGRGGDKTNDTIIVPITEHVVANVKINIANPKGFGDASKVPNKLDLPAKTVMKGGGSGGGAPPLVELPSEHVMTSGGGWDNPKSDWGSRVMPEDEPSYTITEKHRSGQLVRVPSPTWLKKHPPVEPDMPGNTVTSNTGKNKKWAHNSIVDGGRYRRLTVRECMRLQSFPDWWSFPPNVSISRKYRLVGEAVCPILAYRLAIHIGKLMGWKVKEPPKYEEWQLPYFYRAFADYFSEVSKGWMEK